MKQCNKFLALVLAVIMILSNANLGLTLAVSAAEVEYEKSVSLGNLLEQNYGITDAEAAFIDKYLVSETYGYNVPNNDADDMIVIGDGTVEVKSFENWTISEVRLVPADGSETEIITLTDGKGTYAYAGNAFSIEVDYELHQNVDVAKQKLLLGAIDELKRAQAEVATSANADVNTALETVVSTLPALKDLADNGFGITTPIVLHYNLDEATAAAINTLYAQLGEDGKLDLQVENDVIAAVNALEYLSTKGEAYQALVKATRDCLTVFQTDSILSSSNMMETLKAMEPDTFIEVSAFMGVVGDLIDTLDTVADTAAWNFDAVKDGVNYVSLTAALAGVTASEVEAPVADLFVAGATLNKGRSMWNITVNVSVSTLANNELYTEFAGTGVVTLIDGTAKADAEAAVAAKVAEILATFDLTNHVVASETALPETLTADASYTITYEPKQYTVDLSYGDDLVVYHGHVYTLPVNANEGKEYDYFVDGVQYLEGAKVVITADTVITRTEMVAYTHYDLYSVIADNFGNAAAKEILKSGVLLGNQDIRVQIPSIDSVELKLEDDVLTVVTGDIAFDAYYNDLVWKLYFGANGNETAFESNTAAWVAPMANYSYVLKLENISTSEVEAVMELVNTLKSEAAGQMSALGALYGYYADMAQLDSITISALKGIIDGTDFKDAEGNFVGDAKNAELKDHFKNALSNIGPFCQDLVAAMGAQNNNTLRHYYSHSAEMTVAVGKLSDELNTMLPDADYEAYLGSLFDALVGTKFEDYIQFKDKIANLKTAMADIKANLKAPNAKIDLDHAKVGELADLLQSQPAIEFAASGTPVISSAVKQVLDSSFVNVMITVTVDGETKSFNLEAPVLEGTVLTADDLAPVKAAIEAFVAENLKCDVDFYTVTGSYDLDSLVGQALEENYEASVSYAIKSYDVTLNGDVQWTITAANSTVNLPVAPLGYVYNFQVNGVAYVGSSYTFSADEIRAGALAVTYTVVDVKTGEFEDAFLNSDVFTPVEENGEYVGLNATLDPSMGGMMEFAFALQQAGYDYIYLNNEPLLVAGDGLELHVQTLINALLADPSFGSDKLIELGLGNGGARSADNNLLNATIQLYKTNPETGVVEQLWDLDFNLFLTEAPAKLVQVAEALAAVDGSFWFKAVDSKMEVHLNLPEKVYEMYLAGMVAAGYKTNDDLTDVNIQVAYAYLCDMINLFADSSITIDTFQNTLDKLHIDRDITKFGPYLNKVKDIINNGTVEIIDNTTNVGVNVNSCGAHIDSLLTLLGIDLNAMTAGSVKIVEIEGNLPVTVDSVVSVDNAPVNYEAVIIDANAIKSGVLEFTDGVTRGDLVSLVKGQGLANGVDFTEDLIARLNGVGASAIMLLDDIDGDLVFNGTTILDLNGKTVKGDIVGNGPVMIIDSNLATNNCGTVEGDLSGKVVVVAGKYADDNVDSFLADGYKVENGYVRNAMYTVEGDFENLNIIINSDFMSDSSIQGYIPSVKGMAADIVADLVLNRYIYASISHNDKVILDMGMDHILSVLDKDEPIEFLVNELMSTIRIDNASSFMNDIIAQLLDFGGIAEALKNETPIISYKLTTSPWIVKVYNNNNTIDLGICANENVKHELNISLAFDGNNAKKLINFFEHLDAYVDASLVLNLKQPVYDDQTLYVGGDGLAKIDIDLTVNKEWQTLIAVVVAYGNPEKAAGLVDAIDNEFELRKLFNKLTVEDLFTGLKAMNHETSFGEMADSLGVELDAPGRESLENLYHLALCAFGKGLEKLDITGCTDVTMGMVETETLGVYGLLVNGYKHPNASYRGWTLDVETLLNTTGITIKIFDYELPEAEWKSSAQFGNSLALAIGFYVPEIGDADGYTAVITRTYKDGREADVITLDNTSADWWKQTVQGKEFIFVRYNGIAAKEMIDEITVQVYNADGEMAMKPYTESVMSYAMRALEKHSAKNASSTLYVDLLNYGASAQNCFGYAVDTLANADLTAEQQGFASSEISCENSLVKDANFVGSALQFKSEIRFAMVFKNIENAHHAVVSFTNHNGQNVNVTVDPSEFLNNGAAVVVKDIRPADYSCDVTITVYDAQGEVLAEATDNMESYAARADHLDEIYSSFMKYAAAALEYYNSRNN